MLVTETYGGKIDDEGDFKQLSALVNMFLTPDAFEDDHELVPGQLKVPGGIYMKGFLQWVGDVLPEREPPTFLGLPANAEKLLLVGQGERMCKDLRRVRDVLEEAESLGEADITV
jgi:dynein heavy chain 1